MGVNGLLKLLGILGAANLMIVPQQVHATAWDPTRIDIEAVAVQPDGKLLVSGSVYESSYNGLVFMRINADGSADRSFQRRGSAFSGYVNAMLVQPDGKILIGGDFERAGASAPGLVRLNADGSRDDSFKPAAQVSGTVEALALAADSSIWVGGSPLTYQDTRASGLVRLHPDGSLAQDRGVGVYVSDLLAASDGSLLVTGSFSQTLVRLLPDGTRDPDFRLTPPLAAVTAVERSSDGKLVIVGELAYGTASVLLRLNPDGHPDVTFAPTQFPLGVGAESAVVSSDGSVIVGSNYVPLLRVTTDGQIQPLDDCSCRVTDMRNTPDGVIVASDAVRRKHGFLPGLRRLRSEGTLDAQFTRPGSALRPSHAPPAPRGVRVKAQGKRLVMSWRPSSGAMGYTVRTGGHAPKVMTEGTLLNVPGKAGTRVCVRAGNTAGGSAWVCRKGERP